MVGASEFAVSGGGCSDVKCRHSFVYSGMNSFRKYLLSSVPDTDLSSEDQAVNNGVHTPFWLCVSNVFGENHRV